MSSELTHEESLKTISHMINLSKNNVQHSSFYFLLWGWVVALAFLGHYILMVYVEFENPSVIWLIAIPAAIASGIYGYRTEKKILYKTHFDDLYTQTWLAFLLPLLMILFFGNKLGLENTTALILMLAGSGTYISSRILRFKPSLYGSLIIWVTAILSFIYNNEYQYLLGVAGIVMGYLIPGYLLRKKEQSV